ncbi:MAG TPA: DNA polymerase III subunit beta [Acidimicrobiia bacterium]|nr:DNA polymerase III subunit beta [Acidimicrobiia bacterium]
MRIRAERDDLVDVLSRASRAVGVRSPLPILQGVLVEVTGKSMRVTGTDLEVTVRTDLEVEVMEPGRTVIPARLATEAVRKLPPGAVVLQAEGGEIEISGGGPRFRFREFNVEDYPKIAEPDLTGAVTVDGAKFAAAISQVSVAASNDDARPILTGVYFENEEGKLRMVTTDSYRLAVRDLPAIDAHMVGLVPVRALKEIGRSVATSALKVAVGDREAAFASDRGSLTARLIEGTFPNYRQLIPASYPNRVVVARDALLEAIDRASLVAEDHIPIRMTLQKGGIDLSVTRQDVGGETEHVDAEYSGEEMTIAFNSRYLNDGVGAIDTDGVILDIMDPLKPGVLRGVGNDDYLYLLMPVRL